MKKILLLGMLLAGAIVFAGKYEDGMTERMKVAEEKFQPALNSGVTADMNDATQKLGKLWETEMRKIYDLLLSELPEKEKVELQEEQEKWAKKIKDEIAKDAEESKGGTIGTFNVLGTALGNTEKRALELAKRYDKLNK
ncbi:hypothetical protein JCM16777_0287 [Leptotrichia wadei]|uniref:Lysozyme inhibitor LprI-like N-terminal domain-containing protein n=1 Tax=Leptotrichia wadei TaxID=157687 RepID=A0A7U6L923_9FUSO|nr:lysozyme inhibitor LprI family protein [Leptotrichia wadei]BBM42051.1 hypothetical protein JCM16777_0287 [Leptotrichia wadei]